MSRSAVWLSLLIAAVAIALLLALLPFSVTVGGVRESCGIPVFYSLPSDPGPTETDRERAVFQACSRRGVPRILGAYLLGFGGIAGAIAVVVSHSTRPESASRG